MKPKKRIKQLEKEVAELKSIVAKNSITLTDKLNPNVSIVMSVEAGVFSTDRVTTNTSVTTDNITNQQ